VAGGGSALQNDNGEDNRQKWLGLAMELAKAADPRAAVLAHPCSMQSGLIRLPYR